MAGNFAADIQTTTKGLFPAGHAETSFSNASKFHLVLRPNLIFFHNTSGLKIFQEIHLKLGAMFIEEKAQAEGE